jgi:hypothetical protein
MGCRLLSLSCVELPPHSHLSVGLAQGMRPSFPAFAIQDHTHRPSSLRPHVSVYRYLVTRHSTIRSTGNPTHNRAHRGLFPVSHFQPRACTFSRYPVNIRLDLPLLPFFCLITSRALPNFDDISILSIGMIGPLLTSEALIIRVYHELEPHLLPLHALFHSPVGKRQQLQHSD